MLLNELVSFSGIEWDEAVDDEDESSIRLVLVSFGVFTLVVFANNNLSSFNCPLLDDDVVLFGEAKAQTGDDEEDDDFEWLLYCAELTGVGNFEIEYL